MPVILIADGHPLFRDALRGLIGRLFPRATVHEAGQISVLYDLAVARRDASLLLLDLELPGSSGFGPLVQVRSQHPHLPVVVLSAHDDPLLMRRAVAHGVMGFIPKSVDVETLCGALRQAVAGKFWLPQESDAYGSVSLEDELLASSVRELTPQQFRVLQMVGGGLLNKQIAHELKVSEATIKTHMTAVMRKLCVSNRTQAVLIAGRLGMTTWR
ncbi:response regulator transcription factor [Achromobacter seleniivolatilans]|uniref:Response regulator transcription factor n=1 Tax=Achromobacter seleniivolatilans TaxID=3047478 RepID=A0ABY9M1Q3_9BURK|nr:response regulator transcription factor [Achromobacter sp. R39]WMD20637.1 response regulator transcription factor [Achromobacter sp. R39]